MFISRALICGFAPALALFATAATAPVAPTVDPLVEQYKQLNLSDFEKYTDAEINNAVFAGIHNENPKIVELTVRALAIDAMIRGLRGGSRGQADRAAAAMKRDLRAVPGLKDFLIAYARSGVAEHGWEGVDELDVEDFLGKDVWRFTFLILVTLYPQDPDVYALFDKSYSDRDLPINLLNAGLFFHEAADQRRIAALSAGEFVAAEAAQGLAMSGSTRGLEALRGSLWRRDFALPAIAEALVVLNPSEVTRLRGLSADYRRLGPDRGRKFDGVVALAETALGSSAVRTDADGVPLVQRAQYGPEVPLDQALQFYDRFYDSDVVPAVAAGLGSGDARVVEQTVLTLGSYSMMVALRDWPVFGLEQGEALRKVADPRLRRLNEVPGLRAFLIDYANAGMNDDACRALSTLGPRQLRPAWMQALTPLVVYFPGHAAVERLLLRFGECLDRAGSEQSILPLLGIGKFRSDAVVRWHIDKLPHPHPPKARWAARGLARFLTDRGLAALVANLSRRDEALADVVEAVAAHGYRATPHLPKLTALESRLPALAPETRERITSATAKIGKLATLGKPQVDFHGE